MKKSVPRADGPLKDRSGESAPPHGTGWREQPANGQAAGSLAWVAETTKAGRFLDANSA